MAYSCKQHAKWALGALILLTASVAAAQGQMPSAPTPRDWWSEQINVPNLVLLGTFLFHVFGVYFDLKGIKKAVAELERWRDEDVPRHFLTKEVADLKYERRLERRTTRSS